MRLLALSVANATNSNLEPVLVASAFELSQFNYFQRCASSNACVAWGAPVGSPS